MKKGILVFVCFLSYVGIFAQKEQSEAMSIPSSGVVKDNHGELNKEFYEQTRTLLLGLSLSNRTSLQMGISKSRVGNEEILEFPLLFRYQVIQRLSAYAGVQTQLVRRLDTDNAPLFNGFSPILGVDIEFTPQWDAGVQFVLPTPSTNSAPQMNFERTQPLRLRTRIKYLLRSFGYT